MTIQRDWSPIFFSCLLAISSEATALEILVNKFQINSWQRGSLIRRTSPVALRYVGVLTCSELCDALYSRRRLPSRGRRGVLIGWSTERGNDEWCAGNRGRFSTLERLASFRFQDNVGYELRGRFRPDSEEETSEDIETHLAKFWPRIDIYSFICLFIGKCTGITHLSGDIIYLFIY